MAFLVNLQELEEKDRDLVGELPVEELEFDFEDNIIHFAQSLKYDLTAQLLPDSLLVRGRLSLVLDCNCVRCMKRFEHPLEFPDWACLIPTSGEDKAPIIKACVDLTPYVREDMVLAFPQHPLCREDCPGLASKDSHVSEESSTDDKKPSPWDQLNRLKL